MTTKKHHDHYCLLAALAFPFLLNHAQGQVVVGHFGANDPETEGFVLTRQDTPNLLLGPVFDDFGRDAWSIQATTGVVLRYHYLLSNQEREDALIHGWEVSATLRIVEPGAQFLTFYTGTEFFRVWVQEFNGFPLISASSGGYLLDYSDGGYHTFSLVYEPLDGLASLWVDGVERVTGISGRSSSLESQLSWNTSDGPSHIHWNEFSLTIIPEPATVALLTGLAALVAGGILRRRRRKGRLVF